MPFIPNLFITPHALDQFQQRIAPMEKAKAHRFILAGIRQAANMRLLPDGMTLRIRTQRPFPFEFRAICVFDQTRGNWVVTTIVRGDSNVTRKHRRRQSPRSRRETVAPGEARAEPGEWVDCARTPVIHVGGDQQPAEWARDDSTGWSASGTRWTGGDTNDEPA